FRFPSILREDSHDLEHLIQNIFKSEPTDKVEFTIYFGRTNQQHLHRLAGQLFQYIQAPSLRATFTRRSKWILQSIKPMSLDEVPTEDNELLWSSLEKFLRRKRSLKPEKKKYDLAILVDPNDPYPPSDEKAIQKFVKAAEGAGFYCELITRYDFESLIQFDALFIRETTYVNHHTFKFSKKAKSLGLAVIDDP